MAQCPRCLLDLGIHPPTVAGICPNCGLELPPDQAKIAPAEAQAAEPSQPAGALPPAQVAPTGPGSTLFLLKRFWNTLWEIIFRPASFFDRESPRLVAPGGLSSALAFAIIVQWLASFFNFVWQSSLGALFQTRMADMARILEDVLRDGGAGGLQGVANFESLRSQLTEFLFGAGAIILTPFTTLLKLTVTALFVHAAVRFFMRESQERPHSYSTTLKVLCYASAPWILAIFPLLGSLMGWLLAVVAAVIGLRQVYRTTTGRALLAVIFPDLLILAFVFVAAVALLFMAFNVMRLMF